MDALRDGYHRPIDYLRVSITDRCNLRCVYCTPAEGLRPFHPREVLSSEAIVRTIRVAARLGIRRIRLTGGEPLTRADLCRLVEAIHRIPGIEDIGLTTNGTLLAGHARSLAAAGVKRVNVSLDSLQPGPYQRIRRGGEVEDVLKGIEAAQQCGLLPIKINMVPIRGMNDEEIEAFARLTLDTDFHVRFIELMPMGSGHFWRRERCVPTDEIVGRVTAIAPLSPLPLPESGPAEPFRLEGARGVVGFISPLTHQFCDRCNRMRLTADGRLRPCLFSEYEIDLKPALRAASDRAIARLLQQAVAAKPRQHTLDAEAAFGHLKPMAKIGG